MRSVRGQALVELGLCLPVVLVLGLGSAAVVQVADAITGLDAATEAAVSAAARAPDADTAAVAAQARFNAVIADYPVQSAILTLTTGTFERGSALTATSTGFVDLAWESLAIVPARLQIGDRASMRVEPWRTRR